MESNKKNVNIGFKEINLLVLSMKEIAKNRSLTTIFDFFCMYFNKLNQLLFCLLYFATQANQFEQLKLLSCVALYKFKSLKSTFRLLKSNSVCTRLKN